VLLDEVETTRVRQARIGDPGRGGEQPVPWHEEASAAAAELGNAVSTLARHVSETRGQPIPTQTGRLHGPPCPSGWCAHPSCRALRDGVAASPLAAAAVWLAGQVEWLRHRPEGPEWMSAVVAAVDRARRVVDRRADRWYAGPCEEPTDQIVGGCPCACHGAGPGTPCDQVGGCGLEWHRPVRCRGELYARPGADFVACPVCGAVFDVAERRGWLLAAAEETLAHAELIGRAIPSLAGLAITPSQIRNLADRSRIVSHGVDTDDRPLYKIGEVLEVVRDIQQRKAARAQVLADRAERRRAGNAVQRGEVRA